MLCTTCLSRNKIENDMVRMEYTSATHISFGAMRLLHTKMREFIESTSINSNQSQILPYLSSKPIPYKESKSLKWTKSTPVDTTANDNNLLKKVRIMIDDTIIHKLQSIQQKGKKLKACRSPTEHSQWHSNRNMLGKKKKTNTKK